MGATQKGQFFEIVSVYKPLAVNVFLVFVIAFSVMALHRYIDAHLFSKPAFATWLMLSMLCLVLFALGVRYAGLVEYGTHRWLLHYVGTSRWRQFLQKSHLKHHHDFKMADSLKTRDVAKLRNVITSIFTFLVLFAAHYTAFGLVMKLLGLPGLATVTFFIGVTLRFALFEIEHYCMHVDGSLISKLLTVEEATNHHRDHHNDWRFNFAVINPKDDNLFGTRYGVGD